jgi:hypothetical protein
MIKFAALVGLMPFLVACGTAEPAARSDRLPRTVPQLKGVDEAPPKDISWFWAYEACSTARDSPTSTSTCEATREGAAAARAWSKVVQPAPSSLPRTIARLALLGGGSADLVAWRNAAGDVCLVTEVRTASGSTSSSGPNGPCTGANDPASECPDLCLETAGDSAHYVLSGVVTSRARIAKIVDSTGSVRQYVLNGPLAGSNLRVVMIELGSREWRRIVLLRGERLVAAYAKPSEEARIEDCLDAAEKTFSQLDHDAFLERLKECTPD